MLNLPVYDQLATCRNLLIAGAGGGFDVFCGLPIYLALRQRHQRVHLANYSFSEVRHTIGCERLTDTLACVTADARCPLPYYPELYLSRWFREVRHEEVPIWCFAKTGGVALIDNYRALVDHLGIDGILLVDGGVDSLARGDEAHVGTVVEDALSLLAVERLRDVPLRMLTCIGLGAERDICYAHIMQNIAALTAAGAFLGACSLTPQMEEYRAYEEATLSVFSQKRQAPSVINASIMSAVQGHFGDYHMTEVTRGSRLWVSPFMPLYWFFDLQAVAERNLLLDPLARTCTSTDALGVVMAVRVAAAFRPDERIPL